MQLAGVPIVRRAADAAAAAECVDEIVVAAPPGRRDAIARALHGLPKPYALVDGGPTRQESAARALPAVGSPAVAVHDAARALCPARLFDAALRALDDADGAVVCLPSADTIKRTSEGVVVQTLDRRELVRAQTPQAFRTDVYRRAHEQAGRDGVILTDDSALVERLGVRVVIVAGAEENLKITTAMDLAWAEAFLRSRDEA